MTVVVRMPDGSRQGRRFLKTDELQVNNLRCLNPEQNHPLAFFLSFFFLYFFLYLSD